LTGTNNLSHLKFFDIGCSGGNNLTANRTLLDYGNNGSCLSSSISTFLARLRGGSGSSEGSANPGGQQGGGQGGGAGGGGGFSAASGTAVLSEGIVASVTIDVAGSGYTTTPTVSFCGGGGSGAAGTAVMSGGSVASVSMTNNGSNYSSVPTVVFDGACGGSGGGAGGGGGDSGFNYSASNLASVGSADTGGLWNFLKKVFTLSWLW
jgi:hypothetical protein